MAHLAVAAHAVLYFDLDRQREQAHLRVARGPAALAARLRGPARRRPLLVPRGARPALLRDRLQAAALGAALVPRAGEGGLAPRGAGARRRRRSSARSSPTGSRSRPSPATSRACSTASPRLAAEAIQRARASLGREELDAEFKAVYPLSQRLATLSREAEVRGAAPARRAAPGDARGRRRWSMADDLDTRYVVEAGFGWPAEFLKREVSLDERTWASWVLRSAEEAYLLDNVAGHEDRMPVLVLDEGSGARGVAARRPAARAQPHARRPRPHRARAAPSTPRRAACSRSSPTRRRPRSSSSRTRSSSASSPCATA